MTRIIGVIGGKGGVGKTTLVSNLSCALAALGQNVVAVDANMTTPNLGLHLGLHLSPKTLHDVLKGKVKMHHATYPHPAGFKVVPGNMSTSELEGVDIGKLSSSVLSFYGETDFVILDSAAGLGREAISSMQAAEEILLITNPDLPSVADALKTANLAEEERKKVLGIIINKSSKRSHELTKHQIEKLLNHRVIAEIPEDKKIPKSIAMKIPLHTYSPHSPASVEFNRLAHHIVGREFHGKKKRFSVLDFVLRR